MYNTYIRTIHFLKILFRFVKENSDTSFIYYVESTESLTQTQGAQMYWIVVYIALLSEYP